MRADVLRAQIKREAADRRIRSPATCAPSARPLTSVRAVAANPVIMAVWGLIVAALPVLGHSTWHLYRKVVEPDLSPREDHPRPPHQLRYAAQFPAALFAGEDKQPPGQS